MSPDLVPDRKSRSVNPKRVVEVTAALVVLGAASGTILGLTFLVGGILLTDPARLFGPGTINGFLFTAVFGAILGGIVGPLVSWTLLRRVPIGRAVIECSIGAALGLALGIMFLEFNFPVILMAGLSGILAAAARLYFKYRPRDRS